ncbi:MAG TPA: ATP-binding protein [Thermoanaerobaculia bacterium]|nr:ATP-binding protein [Thermoanaerobaculia bacterium]
MTAVAGFRRAGTSLQTKLFAAILGVLLLSLSVLGFVVTRMQRRHAESSRLAAASRINEVVRQATSYSMLRNDRAALQQIVGAVGAGSGVVGLRISDATGRVAFSSILKELGRPRPETAENRITWLGGTRILSTTTPILNAASCATAACHAHPAQQRVLGVLDIDFSLADADTEVRQTSEQFIALAALLIALTLGTTGIVLWRLVGAPVHVLRHGTERLRQGELGVQIPVESDDELGALAESFNSMSRQLEEARNEITAWTRTLEERVQQKTVELRVAQRQMIEAEKLTSLGKLAAVVAHEINNPLSAILTDAKLMRKWIERGDSLEAHATDMRESLQLIESESRRTGELVRNLLTFARVAPMNITDVDLNHIVRQCMKLVAHKMALGSIESVLELPDDLPTVRGDANQLEQLVLALTMNAIDAMPREGQLRIAARAASDRSHVVITISDNGVGIPKSLLPRLFNPFVTTKEEGKGVGLGLAISRSIIDRHQGKIEVQSEEGKGTTFTITLPLVPEMSAMPPEQEEAFAI